MPRERTPTFWSDLITSLMHEQSVSAASLALDTGLSESVVRGIARGRAFGRIDQIEKILDVLGYEIDAHALAQGK